MSDYHITPNPEGGWDTQRAGGSRASSHHDTQAEAQKAATGYAERSGGGEVRIHGRNGQLRNSNTIGKADPNPPRDRKH